MAIKYPFPEKSQRTRQVLEDALRLLHRVFDRGLPPQPADVQRLYILFKPGPPEELRSIVIKLL